MIDSKSITQLFDALQAYRKAIGRAASQEEKDDYENLAVITEKLIDALKSNDVDAAKILILAFSREVSDSFSKQPPEFGEISLGVTKISKQIM